MKRLPSPAPTWLLSFSAVLLKQLAAHVSAPARRPPSTSTAVCPDASVDVAAASRSHATSRCSCPCVGILPGPKRSVAESAPAVTPPGVGSAHGCSCHATPRGRAAAAATSAAHPPARPPHGAASRTLVEQRVCCSAAPQTQRWLDQATATQALQRQSGGARATPALALHTNMHYLGQAQFRKVGRGASSSDAARCIGAGKAGASQVVCRTAHLHASPHLHTVHASPHLHTCMRAHTARPACMG
eukprot:365126-Chlamydomonas_euryale.AAC.42